MSLKAVTGALIVIGLFAIFGWGYRALCRITHHWFVRGVAIGAIVLLAVAVVASGVTVVQQDGIPGLASWLGQTVDATVQWVAKNLAFDF